PNTRLIVDNGGSPAGTNTVVSLQGLSGTDLSVTGGAIVTPSSSPILPTATIRNLLIASNSWIMGSVGVSSPAPVALTVTSNATIQAGGGIVLDGQGYRRSERPGPGRSH